MKSAVIVPNSVLTAVPDITCFLNVQDVFLKRNAKQGTECARRGHMHSTQKYNIKSAHARSDY